jgi:hypothetical protein
MERGLKEVANILNRIQNLERDKLTLVAAKHLESIRIAFPTMQAQFGPNVVGHIETLVTRLADIDINLNELIEEFQCCKCDLI